MASSQSLKKGQTQIKCQLCEFERTIVCKCIECNLLLCRSCIIQHSKFKNAQFHKLLDIKDIGIHKGEIDFQCIPCDMHLEQMNCLFCRPCDTLVCPLCIAKVHKKHDLIEIKEAYITKLDVLKSGKSQVEAESMKINTKEAELQNLNIKEKENIEIVKEDVRTHGERLKQRVDEQVTKILDSLEQTGNKLSEIIQKEKESLSTAKLVCDENAADADELIQTMDATRFFKHAKSMAESLKRTEFPKIEPKFQSAEEFVPQKLTNIGEIRFTYVTPYTEETIEASLVYTYTTDLLRIDSILLDENNKIWIGSYKEAVLYQAQMKNEGLNVTSKRKIKVWDIARFSQNKILLSVGENILKVLDTLSGDVKESNFDANPFVSIGIHVTKDGKIIIGARKHHIMTVKIFDQSGESEVVNEHQQQTFIYPRKLTSTSNGQIHVVDYCYSKNVKGGRVISLDRNCNMIHKYVGNTEINKKFPFRPIDIVRSPKDNIVVADADSHALHILNNTGQLLTFLYTRPKEILYPYSLVFIDNEHLLIGCALPMDRQTEGAQLHKLKFGGRVFQKTVGISTCQMGTNCAPMLADWFLHSYEADFLQFLLDKKDRRIAISLDLTFHYIDDVLSLNNSRFGDFLHLIYTQELEIKDTTESVKSASYLDLHLEIDSQGRLSTKLYDKRDDFIFQNINFPFCAATFRQLQPMESQLIRYSRACGDYIDFLERAPCLTQKLLTQGYVVPWLLSSLKKFYGRHRALVDKYMIFISKFSTDFGLS